MKHQLNEVRSSPPSLFDLPPEILCLIISRLSVYDATICIRVNKYWHSQFIDRVYHTVDINNIFFHRFRRQFGSTDKDGARTSMMPLVRNQHRIRVLKISFASTLGILFPLLERKSPSDGEDDDTSLQSLYLDELSILFEDDPKDPWADWQPSQPSTTPIDVQPILRILGHSKNLKILTISSKPLGRRGQFNDLARLLAALPSSIEKLNIKEGSGPPSPIAQDAIDAMLDILSNSHMETTATTQTGTTLKNLRALSLFCCEVDWSVLSVLLEGRCPVLDELDFYGDSNWRDDPHLARLISKGSSKGWKTLGFKHDNDSHVFGLQSAEAVLEHAATLENIRIGDCQYFSSSFIQRLLCSAPNLKRFDAIPHEHYNWSEVRYSLMASDIISPNSEWVCLDLESFKCTIGGIPRPDLKTSLMGKRLRGDLHNRKLHTMQQSRNIQNQVLSQLGKLTKLREITLGQDNIDPDPYREYPEEEDDDDLGHQYKCLMMTLDTGLDQLMGLKQLRRMYLEKMSHCQGPQEE
ncbi:hypothetical protein BGZ83_008085, partial [Gryganskiella cystojenkinii]